MGVCAAAVSLVLTFGFPAASTAQSITTGLDGAPDPATAAALIAQRSSPVSAPVMARPQAGAVDPALYILGPGDGLTLHLTGPIADDIAFEVGPDGRAYLRDLGSIALSGLSLSAARDAVSKRVRQHYRGVRTELTLDHVRAMTVYLTGAVRFTGPVVVAGGSRLVDALSDTLFAAGASRRNIHIRHRDGTAVVADLGRFLATGVESEPSLLRDGDVVWVPQASQFVGAFGGVIREARLELGPRDSLSTLLEMVGGPSPAALRDRALFTHWEADGTRDSTWISLDDVLSGQVNPRLKDGDLLFVFYKPEFHDTKRVYVLGQVKRAGQYPIIPGQTRLSDIIESAGGFGADPDLSSIRLIRRRPAKAENDAEFSRLAQLSREEMTESEYESFRSRLAALTPDFRVDWNRLSKGDKDLDPILADGDFVQVDRITRTVRVDGQVKAPGVFEFSPTMSVREYIRLAGGFTTRSAKGKVRVTRAANGQTVLAGNVEQLSPGDFIWVPESADITWWQRFGTLISVAAEAATIYLAFKK